MTEATCLPATNLSMAARAWRHGWLPLVACTVLYGGSLGLEEFAITRMDVFLTIQSMEQAEVTAIVFNRLFEFIRLSLIGIAVWLALRSLPAEGVVRVAAPPFLGLWITAALVASVLIFGSSFAGYSAQFSDLVTNSEVFRALHLILIYVNVLIYYVFVRTVLGAAAGGPSPFGLKSAWLATSTAKSLLILLAVIAIKLAMESVAVSMLGFAPFVAPFWFIPDDSVPYRYFVGQGTRIVAESLAVPVLALLWIVLAGHTVRMKAPAAASA